MLWRSLCIVLLVIGLLEGTPEQPICLNMIVKNESAVIERCLASVKPFIDHWVIVDTGSTDGTQDIIKAYMKDIPGELYERPWKNFEHNRTEALQLAEGKGSYFLFMDADDWLAYEQGFQMPVLTHDMYTIWRVAAGCSFLNHQLVRADLPWRWKGVVHEYLHCGRPVSSAQLEHIVYRVGNDGASHSDAQKFEKYIALLEEAVRQDPNSMRDMISLAKSYSGGRRAAQALALYEQIILRCRSQEDVFWAILETGNLRKELGMSADEVIHTYYHAHRLCPLRVEPIYYLAEMFNQQGAFSLAYACIKSWLELPGIYERGAIFNMDWMKEYGLLVEFSIAAFYVGAYQESLAASEQILRQCSLPHTVRKKIEKNRHMAQKALAAESVHQNSAA